jgi:hypothetical protein
MMLTAVEPLSWYNGRRRNSRESDAGSDFYNSLVAVGPQRCTSAGSSRSILRKGLPPRSLATTIVGDETELFKCGYDLKPMKSN